MGADLRWVGVLEAAGKASGWKPAVSASRLPDGRVASGRGVAMGTHKSSYAAVVADVDVDRRTGRITARHMVAASTWGFAINPGLIENQIVGQQIQGVSRALNEEVRFTRSNVTSLDFVTYPTLRFRDHPKVTTVGPHAAATACRAGPVRRRSHRWRPRSRTRSSTRRACASRSIR